MINKLEKNTEDVLNNKIDSTNLSEATKTKLKYMVKDAKDLKGLNNLFDIIDKEIEKTK